MKKADEKKLREAMAAVEECTRQLARARELEANLRKLSDVLTALTAQGGPSIPTPEGSEELFITVERNVQFIRQAYLKGAGDTLQGMIGDFTGLQSALVGMTPEEAEKNQAAAEVFFGMN